MNESIKHTIEAHPFFARMRPPHLRIIEEGAARESFSTGEFLFVEGEPANHFYLITAGRVVLEAHEPGDGTVPLQTLGPGDVLGWSWLFAPFVWHFRARAVDAVKAIHLDAAHLLASAERDHDFGYELMKRVVQVVIQRLQKTRKQLLTYRLEASMFEERLHG